MKSLYKLKINGLIIACITLDDLARAVNMLADCGEITIGKKLKTLADTTAEAMQTCVDKKVKALKGESDYHRPRVDSLPAFGSIVHLLLTPRVLALLELLLKRKSYVSYATIQEHSIYPAKAIAVIKRVVTRSNLKTLTFDDLLICSTDKISGESMLKLTDKFRSYLEQNLSDMQSRSKA